MTFLLHIETSTSVCSVALSQDKTVIWNKEDHAGMSHSVLLGKFIKEALAFAANRQIPLDGVVISCGPGSYTGLRIGVSTAKGIAYGMDLPLLSVNTLEVMTNHVLKNFPTEKKFLLCPMIDARRMEVYSAIYNTEMQQIRPVLAEIITENSFSRWTDENTLICFGNGAQKCKETLQNQQIRFIDNISPLASDMVEPAVKAFEKKEFQDVAYFEPFYLKEFVATTPKQLIIKS